MVCWWTDTFTVSGTLTARSMASAACRPISESVGVAHNSLVLGKHSGRRALEHRLTELGHNLTRAELDEVYHRFTDLTDRKKLIYDQDLLGLLHQTEAVLKA